MSNHITHKIWLIGAGAMAVEYAKVLAAMKINPVVIGRGRASAQAFQQATGLDVVEGGIDAFLRNGPETPEAVIIAVGVVDLARTAASVLNYCQPKILLEKPGAVTSKAIEVLRSCQGTGALYIGYNRRFLASTQAVREMLSEDGGPVSCTFEFTEWAHRIVSIVSQKDPDEMTHWLIANSSHVIDMAFYLTGFPTKLSATVSGSLPWHPAGSAFAGSGVTDRDVLFSYTANWNAPGRWGVEVMSTQRRFRLCPLESVQIQRRGEIGWTDVRLDNPFEQDCKPGLYHQVKAFLSTPPRPGLCTFNEFVAHFPILQQIAGYSD